MKPRTHACADCPTLVEARATRCKPCAMRIVGRNPERIARLHAGLRAKMADPAHVEYLRQHIRGVTERRIEAALDWCPPAFRDEWRRWSREACRVRTPIADRRRMFLAKIKADTATLSPFERQERALAAGARLVANVRVAL